MSSLFDERVPDGRSVLKEGINIGREVSAGSSRFCEERGVRSESEWKRLQAEKGNIQWNVEMGLSTAAEQAEALEYLWEWGKQSGIVIDRCLSISNMINGLPLELREKAPRGTSFELVDPEDWAIISQAAPIAMFFGDHHVGSPNSVFNTLSAIKAGTNTVGALSQYTWTYPYCDDEVAQVVETVKALGILAAKRDDGIMHESSIGDGISGQFLDRASEIGYMLFEQYVVEELCGADYCAGLGYLMSDIPSKLATWLALHDCLKACHTGKEHNYVSFIQGNTLEPTEDINTNYALTVAEFIPFAVLERTNKTGVAYMADPAAECMRVPTLEEIVEVFSVCNVSLKKSREFEHAKMFDFSEVERLRKTLADAGLRFFNNIVRGLMDLGVETEDPVQVLLAVRRLGASRLESDYHPGERDASLPRGIVPFVPVDLLKKPMKEKDDILEAIRSEHPGTSLGGVKVVVGSGDSHEYGTFVVSGVLNALGAEVVDGGIELTPERALGLLADERTPYLAVSIHNGQGLDWGSRLVSLAMGHEQDIKFFMGGRLNAILEGETEPVDITDILKAKGIIPCQDVVELTRELEASARN